MSYSHAADGQLAPALQRALQTFAKPWYALRACRVFRDKTTLSMTSELWPDIESALLDSEYFLLLASPEAARSPWVVREVERWCEKRAARNVLIVLTGGVIAWDAAAQDFDWSKTDALPSNLARCFPHEPLHVDLRWARAEHLSGRHPHFLEATADIACKLRGLSKDEVIGLEVREQRRTRRLVRLVIALLLTLAAGASYAAVTAQRALRAAEERRIQARGVAEAIIFEINEHLLGVPEAADVRRVLGEKARWLLDVLGGDTFDQRAVRATLVQHSQRAEAARAHGDLQQARAELEQSLRLARRLSAYNPMNGALRRDVSVCLSLLVEVLTAMRDYEAARRCLEEDLSVVRELLEREPSSLQYRQDLAISLEKLGKLCVESADLACAEPALTQDVAIMRELHGQYPAEQDVTRGLAIALTQYDELRVTGQRWTDAREAFEEAVTLQAGLGDDHSKDARRARESSVSLLKLGDAHRQLRDEPQALTRFKQALAIRRNLLARSPKDGAAQRDLAVVLGRVADVYFALNDDASALAPTNEAIALYEDIAANSPTDLEASRDLALNLYDRGGAKVRLEQFVQAGEDLTRSVALLEQVHAGRHSVGSRAELFQALRRAGLTAGKLTRTDSSRELHAEACALERAVPAETLDDAELTELVLDLAQISEAQAKLGPTSELVAQACARDALARLGTLQQRNPQVFTSDEMHTTLEQMQRIASRRGKRALTLPAGSPPSAKK